MKSMHGMNFKVAAKTLMVLFLFPLILFTGCMEKKEEGKSVIHFVTWKPNIPGVMEEVIRGFESEHPDIKVVRETGPHSSTAFHDLLTQKLKNRSKDVDVFLMDVIWPPEFGAAGWAMPLDEYFPASEQEKFLKGPVMANTYEGHIYGMPLFVDSGILYYRKDLLDKYKLLPPRTWQEMVRQAQWIVHEEEKEGVEIYGFTGQFKQYEGLVCDMMEYILSNGGLIVDPETGMSGLAGAPAVEAVTFVKENIIGNIAPKGVLTYQEPESLDVFVQGKAVFHRNWPYAWEVSNNPERSRIAGNVGIARLPHFQGHESFSTLGGWQVGVSSHSASKEAALLFAKYLTGEKTQEVLALKAGRAPTRKALYTDPEILKAYPHFSEMEDVFLTAYPRPRTPLYPAVSNVLQRYFSRAISSPDADILKEAKSASDEINKIMAMDRKQ